MLKKRQHPESGVVQYRVKWRDYNHRFNLWKSVEELEQGVGAISDFEALVQDINANANNLGCYPATPPNFAYGRLCTL